MPAFGFHTQFDAQIEFFRAKVNLPTERWDDIMRQAHDRAFIVAGVGKADLLSDLRGAVDKAIGEGGGLEQFRKDFRAVVQKHGWTGWTGEGTKAGEAWRTKVIYQTNMATSYSAGRYRQMTDPAFLKLRPDWRYVHSDSVIHPRPLHLAWNGLVLPHDHPFWATHFPPNGWGCQCGADPVDGLGAGDRTTPPEWWDTIDPKTGAQMGIDKGFDYAPGANVDTSLRQLVQDKLIGYPDAITTALSRDVTRYINAQSGAAAYAARVLDDRAQAEPLWLGFVENFDAVSAVAGRDVKGYLVLLPDEAPRHALKSHAFDGGAQRAPVPEDYAHIWEVLSQADELRSGEPSVHGLATVVAYKRIGDEVYRAVFEVRPGKKNRALALFSLVIKTAGGG